MAPRVENAPLPPTAPLDVDLSEDVLPEAVLVEDVLAAEDVRVGEDERVAEEVIDDAPPAAASSDAATYAEVSGPPDDARAEDVRALESPIDTSDAPLAAGPPPGLTFEEISHAESVTPAQSRLGSEALGRLRARHAEVLARISEKIADPVRRDELKSQAERLNPDTWVTDAEVTAGLEAYETVFEAVRGVVGRRRKRRRSRGRPQGPAVPGDQAAPPEPDDTETPGAGENEF